MSDTAVVVGEALIDIVQHEGRPLGEHVGGSSLNVAVGLALLGRPVEFLTWIGDDRRGQRIADYLHDGGVALIPGRVRAERTATAVADLDGNGSATYQFDIDWQVPQNVALESTLVLHTGSIATALASGAEGVTKLIETHAATSTISFDPNGVLRRRRAGPDPGGVRRRPIRRGERQRRGHAVARTGYLARGSGCGSFAACAEGGVRIPAYTAAVVDTVGAGDAFMNELIDALWDADLLGAHRREQLRGIGADALLGVLKLRRCRRRSLSPAPARPFRIGLPATARPNVFAD